VHIRSDHEPTICLGTTMRQVVIYPDPEDGGWVAEVPSLPGCISQGETKEEVIENVRDAIQTWIEGAQTVGMKVPDETFDVQLCVV
jgi:predicted RNase H-like HicB family nuclease